MLKLVIYSLSIIHHSWQIVTKHIVSTECWICSIWWHITSVDTGFTGIQVLGYHCYLGNNKYIHILLQDIIHTLFISDWCSISPPPSKNIIIKIPRIKDTLYICIQIWLKGDAEGKKTFTFLIGIKNMMTNPNTTLQGKVIRLQWRPPTVSRFNYLF